MERSKSNVCPEASATPSNYCLFRIQIAGRELTVPR